MARLVKFTTEPHKYFAKRKGQFWPLNLIISSENFKVKKEFHENNLNLQKVISQIISEYIKKIPQDRAKAHTRGSIIKRQHEIADILTLASTWQLNVEHEVEAMLTLAQSIAETIVCTPLQVTNIEDIKAFLSNQLKNFFFVTIAVSENMFTALSDPQYFKYFLIIKSKEEQNSTIKININKEEHVINIHELNMQKVLSQSIKDIMKKIN
jgi:hypothetical protein